MLRRPQRWNLTTATAVGSRPFLHQTANNPHYVVFVGGDGLTGETGAQTASTDGTIWVGPTVAAAVPYDSQTSSNGCNTPSL